MATPEHERDYLNEERYEDEKRAQGNCEHEAPGCGITCIQCQRERAKDSQ